MSILGTVFGALGSLGSSLIGTGTSLALNKKDKEFIQAENQKSRDFEIEMWNKANEYNMPSAVMERLRNAGLNPNLVYDNGAESLASYAHAPGHSAPNMNSKDIPNGLNQVGAQIAQLIMQKQQTDSNIRLNDSAAYKNYQEGDKAKNEARSADVDAWVKEQNVDKLEESLWYILDEAISRHDITFYEAEDLKRQVKAKVSMHITDENGNDINAYDAMAGSLVNLFTESNLNNDLKEQLIRNTWQHTELLRQETLTEPTKRAVNRSQVDVNITQMELNQSARALNFELARTQQSQRDYIAAQIRQSEYMVKELVSKTKLNYSQAKAVLQQAAVAVMNGNIDAFKADYTQRYGTTTVGTVLNFVHDVWSGFTDPTYSTPHIKK